MASGDAKERAMKQYLVAGLAAALITGGLVGSAPPASAGCINPAWAGHPLAQMCDDPVTSDGMWQRCVTYYPNGVRNLGETDCYLMSDGNPPAGDPVLSTPPARIDP
jgi:hypothetical protein